jgi:hypothetical protein
VGHGQPKAPITPCDFICAIVGGGAPKVRLAGRQRQNISPSVGKNVGLESLRFHKQLFCNVRFEVIGAQEGI